MGSFCAAKRQWRLTAVFCKPLTPRTAEKEVVTEDVPFNRIVRLRNGIFGASDLYDIVDKRYELVGASSSPDGKQLIVMSYKDPNTSEELPGKLYYLSQTDT